MELHIVKIAASPFDQFDNWERVKGISYGCMQVLIMLQLGDMALVVIFVPLFLCVLRRWGTLKFWDEVRYDCMYMYLFLQALCQ